MILFGFQNKSFGGRGIFTKTCGIGGWRIAGLGRLGTEWVHIYKK